MVPWSIRRVAEWAPNAKLRKIQTNVGNSSGLPHQMFLTSPNATSEQIIAQCVRKTSHVHHYSNVVALSKFHSFVQ